MNNNINKIDDGHMHIINMNMLNIQLTRKLKIDLGRLRFHVRKDDPSFLICTTKNRFLQKNSYLIYRPSTGH